MLAKHPDFFISSTINVETNMNLKCTILSTFLKVDLLMLIKFFYNCYYTTIFYKNQCTKYQSFRKIVPVKISQMLSVINPVE